MIGHQICCFPRKTITVCKETQRIPIASSNNGRNQQPKGMRPTLIALYRSWKQLCFSRKPLSQPLANAAITTASTQRKDHEEKIQKSEESSSNTIVPMQPLKNTWSNHHMSVKKKPLQNDYIYYQKKTCHPKKKRHQNYHHQNDHRPLLPPWVSCKPARRRLWRNSTRSSA